MNRSEYNQLLAERSALQGLIAETPVEEAVDLGSLQARLESVNLLLAARPADWRLPIKACLTFRGRPVVGSHGIFAEFGMTATKAFTDTVLMQAAAFDVALAPMGPIPNRRQNQMLITRTAVGSFGFELEEYRDNVLPLEEESTLAQALFQTQELLQSAASGSDDELTDAAFGKDERVVAAARTFLKTLIDNEAVCGIAVQDKVFHFSDVGEVRRSWARLDQNNLHEQPESLEGVFEGTLPKRRTFEFRVTDTSEVITGKIGPGVVAPAEINQHLYQNTLIGVIATRVGQGHARYVLNRLPDWSPSAQL